MIYCPYRKNNYFQYLKICSTYNSNISLTIPKEISKKKKKRAFYIYSILLHYPISVIIFILFVNVLNEKPQNLYGIHLPNK